MFLLQGKIASIDYGDGVVLYDAHKNQIITDKKYENRRDKETDRKLVPSFGWESLSQNDDYHIKYLTAYVPEGTLCAVSPDAQHPIITTDIESQKNPQVILVDKEGNEIYRRVQDTVTSLIRSPEDPEVFVVGYQNGGAEMISICLDYYVSSKRCCEDIHPPFVFSPHGTQLVGTRDQGIVIIPIAQSRKESDFIKKVLLKGAVSFLETLTANQQLAAAEAPFTQEVGAKVLKKKKKSGKRKKKKKK